MRRWFLLGLMLVLGCGGTAQMERSSSVPPGLGDPPPPVPKDGDVAELVGAWYTVVKGDSITTIAGRYGVPPQDLIELNGVVNPNRLSVGQSLFVYGVDEIIRRKSAGSKGARGAKSKGKRSPRIKIIPKKGMLAWPIKAGRTTSGYGPRWGRIHRGLDLAAPIGTPVLAAAKGVVLYSDNKQRGYGNLVIIQHESGLITVYAHNRRNLVDEGMHVRQGAKIAELGNTGRSSGPHLHFEVRVNGKAVDPIKFLPKKRGR